MSRFAKYGLEKEDGISVSLVDDYRKPLPFLNTFLESLSEPNGYNLSFVPTKPPVNWNITIPVKVNKVPNWFFPTDASSFTIGTDDEQTFGCRFVRQDASAGLHFTQTKGQIQQYFRERLKVAPNAHVTSIDFAHYGTDSFLMFRLDETVYFLDFSSDLDVSAKLDSLPPRKDIILETRFPQQASRRAQKEALLRGIPFYPGRLESSEPLPYLAYNLGEMVVVRRCVSAAGSVFQVTLERMQA